MAFSFGGFSGAVPSYEGVTPGLDMGGLANQINQNRDLAGSYFNADRIKKMVDTFAPYLKQEDMWLAPVLAYQDAARAEASDPKRLQEQLDVLGPWYEKIAEKSQKFGLQSNLIGAGLNAIGKIPEYALAMRSIPLTSMANQVGGMSSMFGQYATGGGGFSGIRNRIGRA